MTTHSLPADEARDQRATALSRWTASVVTLLDQRRDLHGVSPMAELVYDAARWTA